MVAASAPPVSRSPLRTENSRQGVARNFRRSCQGSLAPKSAIAPGKHWSCTTRMRLAPENSYNRARWMDPRTGRFTTYDHGPPTGYTYANADPVNLTDPTGYFGVADVTGVLAVLNSLSNVSTLSFGIAAAKKPIERTAYELMFAKFQLPFVDGPQGNFKDLLAEVDAANEAAMSGNTKAETKHGEQAVARVSSYSPGLKSAFWDPDEADPAYGVTSGANVISIGHAAMKAGAWSLITTHLHENIHVVQNQSNFRGLKAERELMAWRWELRALRKLAAKIPPPAAYSEEAMIRATIQKFCKELSLGNEKCSEEP